jgi:hypothetical protein
MVSSVPASTTGSAFTVTTTSSVPGQALPETVPVTVYVVVAVAVKATPSVIPLSHEYESAPEADRVTDAPSQTSWSTPALIAGAASTEIVIEAHPALHAPLLLRA